VVLNSMSAAVVAQSIGIMERHALIFDALGLPRTAWSAMTLHGGKGGRGAELVETIRQLSPGIRKRLVLENDEHAYGAEEILGICQRAKVPMVFDLHHHLVKEKLRSYDDPSVAEFIARARETWSHTEWQLVHLSNGARSFNDAAHSELIRNFPKAIWSAPWIEVEAKGKEQAIRDLRGKYPSLR
jgi:UV DNA damage endonuclease